MFVAVGGAFVVLFGLGGFVFLGLVGFCEVETLAELFGVDFFGVFFFLVAVVDLVDVLLEVFVLGTWDVRVVGTHFDLGRGHIGVYETLSIISNGLLIFYIYDISKLVLGV